VLTARLPSGRAAVADSGNTWAVPTGFLAHPRPIAFAHRGGASHFPENSWLAFEHAVKLGYAYLETDAQATADGALVAFHDRTLDRVTDATGRIAALPYSRVAGARIAGREPIPLLADLLNTWPDVRFNIDVKDSLVVRPLAEVLRRTAAWDRVCITSFSAWRLHAVRQVLSHAVCMATSPAGIAALSVAVPARTLAARFACLSVRCAQIPLGMATGRFISRAHAAGLEVHVWTVNDATDMNRVLDLGADGVMTDDAVTLRDVLRARGQWHPRQTA
jgi:glycerophosphoryl diester phosphodiesterase